MSGFFRAGSRWGALAGLLLALGAIPQTLEAQPFSAWARFNGTHGFVQIPHHPSLNPTAAFTFEAWINLSTITDCRSIAGKGWQETWWIGVCVTGSPALPRLRSYLKGTASQMNGGIIPLGTWTHVAVVFNGTRRLHYINGERVLDLPETGPLTTNDDAMRIGSDTQFQFTPNGSIDEVRLWSVARTEAQLRNSLNERVNTAQPGLVGVWALDGNASDVVGARDGATGGSIGFLTFPVVFSCGASTSTVLCLQDRFQVRSYWRTSPIGEPTDGIGQVAVSNSGSGIFWFFSADNWELMVKSINGCGLNNRHWLFSAAMTNVFYRVEVFDVRAGEAKIYFNYPGPPAPAVTDTSAFATCP